MWVGVGGVASSLPLALTACTPENKKSQTSTTVNSADGFQSIGTVAQLNQKGQILKNDSPRSSVLVVSDPANPKHLVAVNPICTHRGCTVEWKKDKNAFVCPCHDAEYSLDGKVIEGPATKALPVYEAKIEVDSVLVKTT